MNKKELRLPALVILGVFALYGCVLAPLYQYVIFDTVLMDTLLLDVVDLLFRYAEILGGAALLGFLSYALYRYGLSGARPMLLLAVGAVSFKFLSTVVSISIINGSVNLVGGLTEYLLAFFLDLLLIGLCVLIAYRKILPAVARHRECVAAAAVLDTPYIQGDGCYPFEKLFRYANPLQRTVFWSVLVMILWHSAAFFIDYFSYPAPIYAIDLIVLGVYWVVLILLPGFLGYLLSIACIRLYAKKTA